METRSLYSIKRDKSLRTNYHLGSFISAMDKMIESITSRSICDHLEKNKWIDGSQRERTNSRSCLTNLIIICTGEYVM